MKNEAEKPTKLGDDSSVSRTEQHEKTIAERATVKKKKKYRNSPQSLLLQTRMTQIMNKNLQ